MEGVYETILTGEVRTVIAKISRYIVPQSRSRIMERSVSRDVTTGGVGAGAPPVYSWVLSAPQVF